LGISGGAYNSIIISKDECLLACGSYVEQHPIRAKIVDDPKDFRWSNYPEHVFERKDPLVDEHPIYEQFGA
jgi:putative transposase